MIKAKSNRYAGLIWVLFSVSLAIAIISLIYYFQSVKREQYFNQLYFRELEEMARGLDTNLGRFQSYINNTRGDLLLPLMENRNQLDVMHNRLSGLQQQLAELSVDAASEQINTQKEELLANRQLEIEDALARYQQTALTLQMLHETFDEDMKTSLNDEFNRYFSDFDSDSWLCDAPREDVHCQFMRQLGVLSSEMDAQGDPQMPRQWRDKVADIKVLAAEPELDDAWFDKVENIMMSIDEWQEFEVMVNTDRQDYQAGDESVQSLLAQYWKNELEDIVTNMEAVEREQFIPGGALSCPDAKSKQQAMCQITLDSPIEYLDTLSEIVAKNLDHYRSQLAAEKSRVIDLVVLFYLGEMTLFIEDEMNNAQTAVDALAKLKEQVGRVGQGGVNQIQQEIEAAIVGTELEIIRLQEAFFANFEADIWTRKVNELQGKATKDLSIKLISLCAGSGGEGYCENIKSELTRSMQQQSSSRNIALVIGELDNQNMYEQGSFFVTHNLDNLFRVQVPVEDLLNVTSSSLDAVLLARSGGQVLASKYIDESVQGQSFISINDLISIDEAEVKDNSDQKDSQETTTASKPRQIDFSFYQDKTIAGVKYRVFIHPHKIRYLHLGFEEREQAEVSKVSQQDRTLYLVGLKPISDISVEKFTFSPSIAAVFLILTISLLFTIPFLKIRFAGPSSSFQPLDSRFLTMMIASFVVITTITMLNYMVYEYGKRERQQLALNTHADIKASFAQEMSNLLDGFRSNLPEYVDYFQVRNNAKMPESLRTRAHAVRCTHSALSDSDDKRNASTYVKGRAQASFPVNEYRCHLQQAGDMSGAYEVQQQRVQQVVDAAPSGLATQHLQATVLKQQKLPAFESAFVMDRYGAVPGLVIWGSQNLTSKAPADLSFRRYFQRAINAEVWPFVSKDDYQYPIYIERIFNITDGERNTQVSMPIKFKGEQTFYEFTPVGDLTGHENELAGEYSNDIAVIAMGTVMQTFLAPIMPPEILFAVIDNSSGDVVFHSDDARALVENFFAEADDNEHLAAAVEFSEDYQTPRNIVGTYHGEPHRFFVSSLHDDLPYSLIVFYPKESHQYVNMIFVITSLAVCLGLCLLMFFLSWSASVTFKVRYAWIWPKTEHVRRYWLLAVMMLPLGWFNYQIMVQSQTLVSLMGVSMLIMLFTLSLLYLAIGRSFSINKVRKQRQLAANTVLVFMFILGASIDAENAVGYVVALVLVAVLFSGLSNWRDNYEQDRNEKAANSLRLRLSYFAFVVSLLSATVLMFTIITTNKVGTDLFAKLERVQQRKFNQAYQQALASKAKHLTHLHTSDYWQNHRVENHHLAQFGLEQHFCHDQHEQFYCFDRALVDVSQQVTQGHVVHSRAEHEDFLGPLFASINLNLDWPARLQVLSGIEHEIEDRNKNAESMQLYRIHHHLPGLEYLLNRHLSEFIIATLAILGTLYYLINQISIRLLGIQIPKNYRQTEFKLTPENWRDFVDDSGGSIDTQLPPCYTRLLTLLTPKEDDEFDQVQAMLMQSTPINLHRFNHALAEMSDMHLVSPRPCSAQALASDPELQNDLMIIREHAEKNMLATVLLVDQFEGVAFNKTLRLAFLDLLELWQSPGKVAHSLILIADIPILRILTRQAEYPDVDPAQWASDEEITRWSRLLKGFGKFYDWSPKELQFSANSYHQSLILREASIWPSLFPLKAQLDDEMKSRGGDLTDAQVIEFFSVHADAAYRHKWQLCTKRERLLLYQLAIGEGINSLNVDVLTQLLRRGYIRRAPHWHIANDSFQRFILHAEEPEVFQAWMDDSAEEGLWKTMKVPVLTLVFVLVGVMVYMASEALDSFVAIASGILALIPLLLRNFTLLKGSGSSSESSS